jgi:hypothetical protein
VTVTVTLVSPHSLAAREEELGSVDLTALRGVLLRDDDRAMPFVGKDNSGVVGSLLTLLLPSLGCFGPSHKGVISKLDNVTGRDVSDGYRTASGVVRLRPDGSEVRGAAGTCSTQRPVREIEALAAANPLPHAATSVAYYLVA